MDATEQSALIQQIEQCADCCENCSEQASGLMPDRRIIIYCRDSGQKCRDFAEALGQSSDRVPELALECLHSVERSADILEMQSYEFCRECAKRCRAVAEGCRSLAQPGAKLM